MEPRINKRRRARRRLCKQLGITNKHLKKHRILRQYDYVNGDYLLLVEGGKHATI